VIQVSRPEAVGKEWKILLRLGREQSPARRLALPKPQKLGGVSTKSTLAPVCGSAVKR
jgi:hypothetical protein